MNKKQNINIRALWLLLIYIFSNTPTTVFHNHNHQKVAYETATPCEKNIYYGVKSVPCSHHSHISKTQKKCALCDHHNLASHLLEIPFFSFTKTELYSTYVSSATDFISTSASETSNRGPPTV